MDTPTLQNCYFFFRLFFKKPLDKRLSCFLAIMTRENIEAQHLNTILQKKLLTTNILYLAKQIEGHEKGFQNTFFPSIMTKSALSRPDSKGTLYQSSNCPRNRNPVKSAGLPFSITPQSIPTVSAPPRVAI